MFYGRWDLKIDEKWRLSIPAAIRIDNFLLLTEGDDGCITIRRPPLNFNVSEIDPASIYIMEVEAHGQNGKRVLVPRALRSAISFFYGRKVTLVGKGDHLELWPRP